MSGAVIRSVDTVAHMESSVCEHVINRLCLLVLRSRKFIIREEFLDLFILFSCRGLAKSGITDFTF